MNTLADSVQRVGFRKWYERQLLSSHAHMVLSVLSVVGLLGSLEATRGAEAGVQAMDVLMALACTGIGIWSIRRYLFLLMRAEETANQATCPDCGTYGRFRVLRQRPAQQCVDVGCAKCAREWSISGLL